jgi:hypothetical protein
MAPKRPSLVARSQSSASTSSKRVRFTATPAYKASTVAAATARRVELKRVAGDDITATLTTVGKVIAFPIPEAGDGEMERDGRMVEHRAWQTVFHYVPTNLVDYEKLRILVVLWKGLPHVPIMSELLDTSSWANIFGQYNIKNAANIEVLSDTVYDVNTQGGLSAATTTFCRNAVLAHKNGSKRFQQSFQTTFADLTQGNGSALFLLAIPLVGGGSFSAVMSSTFVDV